MWTYWLIMEKNKAHYSLDAIKAVFSNPQSLRMSVSAILSMNSLGMTAKDVVAVIQSLRYRDLYKSMTSYRDHRIWQDVYHIKYNELVLYLKFTVDNEGYLIISFKEK